MPNQTNTEVYSSARPEDGQSDVASLNFMITQTLMNIQTVTLVEVVSCTNSGGLSPVGFVDVRPLVHQLTGDGRIQEHGVIFNIPYFRLQGGGNAVIIDPQPGDIGMCGFCTRDISSVKKNKSASAPPSRRFFDWADGLYFGGLLNGTPQQFIRFHAGGIEINSPKTVEIKCGDLKINCGTMDTQASGGITSQSQSFAVSAQEAATFTGGAGINTDGAVHAEQDVTAGKISLQNHLTDGVVPGGGKSGKPVAG